jgi:hypothetical protein
MIEGEKTGLKDILQRISPHSVGPKKNSNQGRCGTDMKNL